MKQRKTLKGGMNSNSFPSPLSPIYGTTNLAKSTKKRRKSSLSIKRKKLSFNYVSPEIQSLDSENDST